MSTALIQEKYPYGWHVEFLAAVMRQIPRPGEIDEATAQKWIQHQGPLKEILAESILSPLNLKLVTKILLRATKSRFVAQDKFYHDIEPYLGIPSDFNGNFAGCFLRGDGKIDEPLGQRTMRCLKLRTSSTTSAIIAELGGLKCVETTLTDVYTLLKMQEKGGEGALITESLRANIFFVRDLDNKTKMVYLYREERWLIEVRDIEKGSSDNRWQSGCRVFMYDTTSTAS